MTRMTGPDCAVMLNSIHTHSQTHTKDQSPGTGGEEQHREGGGGAKNRKKP